MDKTNKITQDTYDKSTYRRWTWKNNAYGITDERKQSKQTRQYKTQRWT